MSAYTRSSSRGENLDFYFDSIAHFPILSVNTQKILALAAQDGCVPSRNKLIESNLRLIFKISHEFYSTQIADFSFMDLVQEGTLGLLRAIKTYNSQSNFTSYSSFWIRAFMRKFMIEKNPTIKIPLSKVYRSSKALHGLDKIPLKKILFTQEYEQSLPVPTNSFHFSQEFFKILDYEINFLTPREQFILKSRFGLGNSPILTQKQISTQLNISFQRISQIEKSIISRLKSKLQPHSKEHFTP